MNPVTLIHAALFLSRAARDGIQKRIDPAGYERRKEREAAEAANGCIGCLVFIFIGALALAFIADHDRKAEYEREKANSQKAWEKARQDYVMTNGCRFSRSRSAKGVLEVSPDGYTIRSSSGSETHIRLDVPAFLTSKYYQDPSSIDAILKPSPLLAGRIYKVKYLKVTCAIGPPYNVPDGWSLEYVDEAPPPAPPWESGSDLVRSKYSADLRAEVETAA